MSSIYLIVDTRERNVHDFIKTAFDEAGVAHHINQINTGDYLICRQGETPEILACIERKTLKDFSASFKDGRYQNRSKMIDLRAETGCQLYFFVEGPAFPKPTKLVDRIPYKNILAAETRLMVRDNIHVVKTANAEGTAQRLLDFVRAFEKTCASVPSSAPPEVPAIVTGVIERSDQLLVAELWAQLAGISLSTGRAISRKVSVADLVQGRAEIDTLRTEKGRRLAQKAVMSLAALEQGGEKEQSKILAGVPGITPATAGQILNELGSLAKLLEGGAEAVGAVKIQQRQGRTVCLGAARGERVCRLLNYTECAS